MREGLYLEIIERCLQLKDEKLIALLTEAKIIRSFNFGIKADPNLKGKVEFRDDRGKVMGTIENIEDGSPTPAPDGQEGK